MTYEQIVEEIHEATFAYRHALAIAMADDALVALPEDVRAARACLKTVDEARRVKDATCAFDKAKAEREERWIAAHEYATAWRREQAAGS